MTRSRDVADTQDNLGGAVAPFVAGKNRIINGAMDFFQRATSASPGASSGYFAADRWFSTPTAAAYTLTQETSIVPDGFQYALKTTAVSGTGVWFIQWIESQNCQDLAGKTVTLSAYCATSSSQNVDFIIYYNNTFGANNGSSGWVALPTIAVTTTSTMPTTPQSAQFSIPSTAKSLYVLIRSSGNLATGVTFTLTGVQLEQGVVRTPFARAGGSIGGELALCQRYYYRVNNDSNGNSFFFGSGIGFNGTNVSYNVQLPVTMRIAPQSVDFSANLATSDTTNTAIISSLSINQTNPQNVILFATVSSGITQFRPYFIFSNGSIGTKFIGLSAEL